MPPRHVALAVLVTGIWGFNFVVIRLGLDSVPPLQLAAPRFMVAVLPVFVPPRPDIPFSKMVAIGLTLFVGQFAFLFPAMKLGMPAGLASVTLQSQAFFTILFAAATPAGAVACRRRMARDPGCPDRVHSDRDRLGALPGNPDHAGRLRDLGILLKHYPASTVAPFSLLVPLFGTVSSYLVLAETFSPLRFLGMALILSGVAVIALPLPRRFLRRVAG